MENLARQIQEEENYRRGAELAQDLVEYCRVFQVSYINVLVQESSSRWGGPGRARGLPGPSQRGPYGAAVGGLITRRPGFLGCSGSGTWVRLTTLRRPGFLKTVSMTSAPLRRTGWSCWR